LLLSPVLVAEELKKEKLSAYNHTALKVCEGVIQLFKQLPDSVWPGYNLAKRPFIFYMPGKWALLFNYSKEIDGFTSYPGDWPDLGTDVLFHQGQYKDFTGQLAFGLSIDTVEVAAVPFMEKSEVDIFGFIVHENFHQYQKYGKHRAFGEIAWEREEKYPIQDRENTALAYLEMRLLMDALEMSRIDQIRKCEDYVKQFVAVRNYRWKESDPFVARYEQGQEINEGIAQYVEIKSIDLMTQLKYNSSLSGLTSSLLEDFSSISMPQYLLKDFQLRITGNSVSPEDMLRNRIYPVGSAQGYLLDYFKIDWKDKAQQAGPEFTFAKLLRDHLGVDESQVEDLLKEAKNNYGYEEVLTSTEELLQEYLDGYSKELESFEAQPGYRIEIDLSSGGLSRSRSSATKKWIVDKGTRELRRHFNIYVLKSNDLLLQVHDTGLFEQNDWDAYKRKVVFFVPEIISLSLDNKSLEPAKGALYQFNNIEIHGNNFKFSYSKPGTITFTGNSVKVNLTP
jgi:hypothetical protein